MTTRSHSRHVRREGRAHDRLISRHCGIHGPTCCHGAGLSCPICPPLEGDSAIALSPRYRYGCHQASSLYDLWKATCNKSVGFIEYGLIAHMYLYKIRKLETIWLARFTRKTTVTPVVWALYNKTQTAPSFYQSPMTGHSRWTLKISTQHVPGHQPVNRTAALIAMWTSFMVPVIGELRLWVRVPIWFLKNGLFFAMDIYLTP